MWKKQKSPGGVFSVQKTPCPVPVFVEMCEKFSFCDGGVLGKKGNGEKFFVWGRKQQTKKIKNQSFFSQKLNLVGEKKKRERL